MESSAPLYIENPLYGLPCPPPPNFYKNLKLKLKLLEIRGDSQYADACQEYLDKQQNPSIYFTCHKTFDITGALHCNKCF